MIKFLSTFLYLIFITFIVFIFKYNELQDPLLAGRFILENIIIFSGLVLFSVYSLSKNVQQFHVIYILFFSIIIVGTEYHMNNILNPQAEITTKKGIIIQQEQNVMTLGVVTKSGNNIYLAQNIYLSNSESVLQAEKGTIIDNEIIFDNVFVNGKSQKYTAPMPVNMGIWFPLWGEKNFKNIDIVSAMFNYHALKPFHTEIHLLLGYYIANFLTILIMGVISIASRGSFKLNIANILGLAICLFCGYFIILFTQFYLLSIIQAIIYLI